MGRRGKVEAKRVGNGMFRAVEKCSDQSDEDYMVDNDEEIEESEEEYVSSAGDETGESLGEFEEEQEEEEEEEEEDDLEELEEEEQFMEKKAKKGVRPKIFTEKWKTNRNTNDFVTVGKKKISSRKKIGDGEKRSRITKAAKNNRVSYRLQESVNWDGLHEYSHGQRNEALKSRKKRRVSYREEDSGICDDSDDNDDEEFMPDEVDDYVDDDDDEDEVNDSKRNKPLGRAKKQGARNSKGQQRRRNRCDLKTNKRKRPGNKRTFTKKTRHGLDHGTQVKQKKLKTTERQPRISSILNSDSDFELEYDEYTVSEEEREQVREANEFHRDVTVSLRSSAPMRMALIGQESVQPRMKNSGKKGKEKKDSIKAETGKQICGICLTEEGKRTVRGVLNCCSHYFCFACIMEWSKVESRCPVCKQRFITITKSAGFDLRTCTIHVPERDQMYQPTEEELRGYLDPYENVICTECNQGGDDALMLLCDICDSPAHTYCVGLGSNVPEGNWYCNGCRPMAVDSLNPRGLNLTLDDRVSIGLSVGSSPMSSMREPFFDLNEAYVPDTPISNSNRNMNEPSSSPTGSGALTVHGRRRIHRMVLGIRRQQNSETNGLIPSASGSRLLGSQLNRGGGVVLEPHHIAFHGGFEANTLPAWRNGGSSSIGRVTALMGATTQRQASTSNDSFNETSLLNEFAGTNANNEPDVNAFPQPFGEGTRPSRRLQGAQHMPF